MATQLDVISENYETHGRFYTKVAGSEQPAELTWRAAGQARVVDHTFTPPAARGKGVAMALVEAIVAEAREEGFTIVPQCPYVAAAFRRHPEWADVRAQVES